MTAKTTHLTRPVVLSAIRRTLLCSTAIDAIAIGAGMINLAQTPVFVPTFGVSVTAAKAA